jgi:hypothetical protein
MFLIMAIVLVVLWVLGAFVFRMIGGGTLPANYRADRSRTSFRPRTSIGQNAAGSGLTALPAAAADPSNRTVSHNVQTVERLRVWPSVATYLGRVRQGFAVLQCLSAYQQGQHRSRSD